MSGERQTHLRISPTLVVSAANQHYPPVVGKGRAITGASAARLRDRYASRAGRLQEAPRPRNSTTLFRRCEAAKGIVECRHRPTQVESFQSRALAEQIPFWPVPTLPPFDNPAL
jgi:hypothetical protein